MRKIRFIILLATAVSVSCAQQAGGDRQMSTDGYGLQSGGLSESLSNMPYGSPERSGREQEYGGGAGGPADTRSAHGFDRGSRTQMWSSTDRPSGPTSGFNSGDMGHGLGTQTSPPSLGGSAAGGTGQ